MSKPIIPMFTFAEAERGCCHTLLSYQDRSGEHCSSPLRPFRIQHFRGATVAATPRGRSSQARRDLGSPRHSRWSSLSGPPQADVPPAGRAGRDPACRRSLAGRACRDPACRRSLAGRARRDPRHPGLCERNIGRSGYICEINSNIVAIRGIIGVWTKSSKEAPPSRRDALPPGRMLVLECRIGTRAWRARHRRCRR
jgi:hypothetical protein